MLEINDCIFSELEEVLGISDAELTEYIEPLEINIDDNEF
jgi:hypothetical protein